MSGLFRLFQGIKEWIYIKVQNYLNNLPKD